MGSGREECPWLCTPSMPLQWMHIMSFRHRGVVGSLRPKIGEGGVQNVLTLKAIEPLQFRAQNSDVVAALFGVIQMRAPWIKGLHGLPS
jgi:hypothetical protein